MASSDHESRDDVQTERAARDAAARLQHGMEQDSERARALGVFFAAFYHSLRHQNVPRDVATQLAGSYISAFTMSAMSRGGQ